MSEEFISGNAADTEGYGQPQMQSPQQQPVYAQMHPVAPYPGDHTTAVVQQGRAAVVNNSPLAVAQLPTDRSLLKFVLLSLITLGIYGIWVTASSADDLNLVASRHDGKRTMNYWLLIFLIGPITLGIGTLVWWTTFPDRIGKEQRRRGMEAGVSGGDFWLWGVLGALIIVGPFIFCHKWLNAMNALCLNYNQNG